MNKNLDKRKERLIGKYLILSNSRYDDNITLYLQDNKYGDGYWTRYMQNAIGYTNLEDAINRLDTIQYNNPIIVIMDINCKLTPIYNIH